MASAPLCPLRYVVTGAARGIGRGLSLALVRAGHDVFMLDSDWAESANTHRLAKEAHQQLLDGLASTVAYRHWLRLPAPPTFRRVDLCNPAEIREAVDEIRAVFGGRLDVLVHNAFPTAMIGSSLAMDDALDHPGGDPLLDAWNVQLAVGLTAPYLLSRLCVPLLVAAATPAPTRGGPESNSDHRQLSSSSSSPSSPPSRGPGCIIHVSSTRARQAEPNHEPYSAAKAGLLGLTRSMASSLGTKHGIRVNAIVPGWIDASHECFQGDRTGAVWAQDVSAEDHTWHWVGRVGMVDDVVGAVEYLASAGFMTGQELVLDGGVSRRMVYPD